MTSCGPPTKAISFDTTDQNNLFRVHKTKIKADQRRKKPNLNDDHHKNIKNLSKKLIKEFNQIIDSDTASSSDDEQQSFTDRKKYAHYGEAPDPQDYAFKIYLKGYFKKNQTGRRVTSYHGIPFLTAEKNKVPRENWPSKMQTADKKEYSIKTSSNSSNTQTDELKESIKLHWSHALASSNYGSETSVNAQLATIGRKKGFLGQGNLQEAIEVTLRNVITEFQNDKTNKNVPLFIKITDYIDHDGRLSTRRYKIFTTSKTRNKNGDQKYYTEILIGEFFIGGMIALTKEDQEYQEYMKEIEKMKLIASHAITYVNRIKNIKKQYIDKELSTSLRRGDCDYFSNLSVEDLKQSLELDKQSQKPQSLYIHLKKKCTPQKLSTELILPMLTSFFEKQDNQLLDKLNHVDANKPITEILAEIFTQEHIRNIFQTILKTNFGTLRPPLDLLEMALTGFRKTKKDQTA